jgi:hypothetical protein
MPVVVFFFVLACLLGAALAGLWAATLLPRHHLSAASKDVIYAFMNVIALLAAVVLGLLIFAAKTSFDTKDTEWKHASANMILLDRVLAHYGPEATGARELLKAAVSRKLAQLEHNPADHASALLVAGIEEVQDAVRTLWPTSDAQRLLKSRALEVSGDIARARWILIENVDSTVPMAFLLVLILWLAFIFFSYGLFAERNATVLSVLVLCALSLAGSVYLIFEMDNAMQGPIAISTAPLKRAFEHIGK